MKFSGSIRKGCPYFAFFMALSFSLADVVSASGGGITVIPDASLFIQIANFLFIIWVLNVILYKPIRNILIQRREKVTGFEKNIEALVQDAQDKDEAYSSGIKDARAQGLKEKEAMIQAAADEEKRIIEELNQKAQAELAQVREKIAKDAEKVRASLQQEIDTFSNVIGEKILGRVV